MEQRLKDAKRKFLKLLPKEVNEMSNDTNKKFDKTVKSLYPHNFSKLKEHVQKMNLNLKKKSRKMTS